MSSFQATQLQCSNPVGIEVSLSFVQNGGFIVVADVLEERHQQVRDCGPFEHLKIERWSTLASAHAKSAKWMPRSFLFACPVHEGGGSRLEYPSGEWVQLVEWRWTPHHMAVVITLQSPSHKVNGRNKLGVRTIPPRSSTSQDPGVLYCASGCTDNFFPVRFSDGKPVIALANWA